MNILCKKVVVIIGMECPDCKKTFEVDVVQIDVFARENQKCNCGHIFDFSVVFRLAEEITKEDFVGYLNSTLKGRLRFFSPF